MDRRFFLLSAASLASVASAPFAPVLAAETGFATGWRRFEITTRVTLRGSPGAARLWLPLAQTAADYQVASAPRWQTSGTARLQRDERYGAGLLRCQWDDAASAQDIEVVQLVATRDRGANPVQPFGEADRRLWTAGTESMPIGGIVRQTAERITDGRHTPRERARAIYDWVVDTTWRDPEVAGCGTGDFVRMLETGNFGGKCADINSLFVGLARAAGLPAREVYGIRVADSRQFPSLGKAGDISKAQHCRAEVFLDDEGWLPVDPADVRKVVLEGKLALDHPDVVRLRERLFGFWEMNWIGYNSAGDIRLPGSDGQTPNFSFLMYPCAFTATGQPDSLDPAGFRYAITAREITT